MLSGNPIEPYLVITFIPYWRIRERVDLMETVVIFLKNFAIFIVL